MESKKVMLKCVQLDISFEAVGKLVESGKAEEQFGHTLLMSKEGYLQDSKERFDNIISHKMEKLISSFDEELKEERKAMVNSIKKVEKRAKENMHVKKEELHMLQKCNLTFEQRNEELLEETKELSNTVNKLNNNNARLNSTIEHTNKAKGDIMNLHSMVMSNIVNNKQEGYFITASDISNCETNNETGE